MKKLIKVKPMWNKIITTMDVYEEDQISNGLIDSRKTKGTLKEYQTVISVGTTVRDIKVGDLVAINPTRYAQMKHENGSLKDGVISDNMVLGYKFNTITINDKEYLMLYDQDVDFIIEESVDVEDPKVTITQPDKPSIVTEV